MEAFMTRTDMITIRISPEERLLYEAEAAYRKQSLSAYLRERLEKSESSSHELQNMHDLLKNLTSSSSSHDQGILLEILLLLRYMAGTEKLYMVRNDLNRLNIPTWKMDSLSEKSKHTT
jgi:hypothetical protein